MDGTIRTRRFTIERASYLKAVWARGLGRRLAITAAFFVALVGATYLWIGSVALTVTAPILLAFIPIAVVIRYLIARRNVYAASNARTYDDPRVIEFTDEGLHVRTESGVESRVPWANFRTVERRGGFTLLFFTTLMHFIVPDGAFASTTDRSALMELVASKGLPVLHVAACG